MRPTSWERILGLQDLQREDLLANFLRQAAAIGPGAAGAQPPSNEEFVKAMAGSGKAAGGGGP